MVFFRKMLKPHAQWLAVVWIILCLTPVCAVQKIELTISRMDFFETSSSERRLVWGIPVITDDQEVDHIVFEACRFNTKLLKDTTCVGGDYLKGILNLWKYRGPVTFSSCHFQKASHIPLLVVLNTLEDITHVEFKRCIFDVEGPPVSFWRGGKVLLFNRCYNFDKRTTLKFGRDRLKQAVQFIQQAKSPSNEYPHASDGALKRSQSHPNLLVIGNAADDKTASTEPKGLRRTSSMHQIIGLEGSFPAAEDRVTDLSSCASPVPVF